ncbi:MULTISPECIES: SDR family NAD(P)-dependent oxidoreductase [Halomonadaceae]|uniref:Beta-ketoacyl-ACP reductase n=1 Tax=Halomonas johnsoniae TaxID=502832 RepID=A0ABQ2WC89_9GAMM|nr:MULTISPECIES: SDR family NAD(P)-dependent oxidoreductase [Halomonas]GGW47884.1 beta-ketoacyl-ACP reductase [Halomonas johnsoniae]
MDLKLGNKIVAITGPVKGMGEAITRAFAEEGAKLALLARDTQAVASLEQALREQGADVVLVACDITHSDQCERAIAHIQEAFGDVPDVLVNVAGGSGPVGKSGAETTFEEFEEIVRLNMAGCFNTMRAVLPGMMARRSGKIVNVGGTFGMRGKAGRMAYSASKWGLRGITKSMALEAGPYNININIVAPGMVDGERFRSKVCPDMAAKLGISEEEAAQKHAADYALQRISTAQDIADACLFMASDRSRQITGADLPVDGGWAAL